MTKAGAMAIIGVLALIFAAAGPAVALQAPAQADELKRDMESLKKTLEAIQKDIQEIKGLLASRGGARSAVGVVLDIAANPFKGEQTAPLTLVEFSDYQ